MKSFLLFLSLLSFLYSENYDLSVEESFSMEKEVVAIIIELEGKAKILSLGEIKKHKAVKGEALYKGDKLISYGDANILVELNDKSKIILNSSSSLTFLSNTELKQDQGEIYYKINKRIKSQGLQIKTPFSIMGIKGTEFIINTLGSGEIALNEGLIGIESLSDSFELHKKELIAKYNEYKSEQIHGFEDYKKMPEDDNVSYVKEFNLKSKRVLHFTSSDKCLNSCGSRIDEKAFTDDLNRRFETYKNMYN